MALSFDNFDLDYYLYMNDSINFEKIKSKKDAYKDY